MQPETKAAVADVDEVQDKLSSLDVAPRKNNNKSPWGIAFFNAPRFHAGDPAVIGGLVGSWYTYTGAEGDVSKIKNYHRALRCYQFPEDADICIFRFFHEEEPPPLTPFTLRKDGLYETQTVKAPNDPYFSTSIRPSKEELEKAGHPCFCWRILSFEDSFLIRLTVCLPPGPMPMQPVGPHPKLHDCLQFTSDEWGLEAILDDGVCRWTMGPRYCMSSLQLVSNVYTREQFVHVRPADPIDMNAMPFLNPRARLDEDPQGWLHPLHQSGSLQETIWDEDGEVLELGSRPTIWSPPDPSDPNSRLIRFEDCMYAQYPACLPSARDQRNDPTLMNNVRIEVGGLVRYVREFRRIVLRFSVNGLLESLSYESYPQPEIQSRRASQRTSFSVEVLSSRAYASSFYGGSSV